MQYIHLPVNFLAESAIKQLSVETQAVAFFLMTAPRINRIGLYHLPLSEIVFHTRLDPYYVNAALYNLEHINFCRYDKINEYIWICNFAVWQDHHSSFELLLKNLPPLCFLNEFYRQYASLCYPTEQASMTQKHIEIREYSYTSSYNSQHEGK